MWGRIANQTSQIWTDTISADQYRAFGERYFDDPVGFVTDCILWENGEGPTRYQKEIMEALLEYERACVRSPHGAGKSSSSAWIIWWFGLTRDAMMYDWKAVTTASAWRQLIKYLWPEVHKWGRKLNWVKIGRREPLPKAELSALTLKLKYGQAFAVASDRPELIEGAHADHMLYLFDESKVIIDGTWDSAEGAMTGEHCFVGSTTVLGVDPRFVSKRWHVGEVIEVQTAGGYHVTVTPDHPVLTPTGWKTFGSLEEGDDILCCRDMQSVVAAVEPNSDHVPTCIQDIFDTSNMGHLLPDIFLIGRDMPTPENFYGNVADRQIDIVFSNSCLNGGQDAEIYQHLVHLGFKERAKSSGAFASKRHIEQSFVASLVALSCHSRQSRSLESQVGIASYPEPLGIEDISSSDIVPGEKFSETTARDTVQFRHFVDGLPVDIFSDGNTWIRRLPMRLDIAISPDFYAVQSEVACDSAGGDAELASKLHGVAPDEVFVDQVLSLCRRQFEGHVYNLQTGVSWYLANDTTNKNRAPVGGIVVHNCFWLAVSTPGIPAGRFYEIQSQKEGYKDWWVRHVTAQEAIDAGRMDIDWANSRREQWGEDSAEYQNRVLGNFAQEEADALIPLHWVEQAQKRFKERMSTSDLLVDQVALDVARKGGDKTVLAKRRGMLVFPLEKYGKIDTMEAAGLVVPYLKRDPNLMVVIDIPGMGAGPYDRLVEQFPDSENLVEFHGQRKTELRDATELLEFHNTHSAAWWNLREMLDPSNPRKLPELLALPPDEDLPSELTAFTWKINSSGKIEVEQKEKVMVPERLGHSPDSADAVVMVCFGELVADAEFG